MKIEEVLDLKKSKVKKKKRKKLKKKKINFAREIKAILSWRLKHF